MSGNPNHIPKVSVYALDTAEGIVHGRLDRRSRLSKDWIAYLRGRAGTFTEGRIVSRDEATGHIAFAPTDRADLDSFESGQVYEALDGY